MFVVVVGDVIVVVIDTIEPVVVVAVNSDNLSTTGLPAVSFINVWSISLVSSLLLDELMSRPIYNYLFVNCVILNFCSIATVAAVVIRLMEIVV